MSNDFLGSFVDKPVRESSGSRTANRFDYQKNWSLCKLLSLHANKGDYLMVFDYHEDVVVFNSKNNPSDAIFYQVKSKGKGNWTVGSLTKIKDEDNSQSILGKLYSNYLRFPEYKVRLEFSSNQGLSAKLKNGDKAINLEKVSFSILSDKEKEKVRLAVEPREQKYCNIAGLKKIVVEKNDLRLSDHTTITKGKLVEFFEKLHPGSETNISLVYKTFFDEVRRKTNYESDIFNKNELLDCKSLSQSSFQDMVNTVLSERSDNELWTDANQLLISEDYSFLEIKNIRTNWQRYLVDRMNVESELHMQLQEAVCKKIKKAVKGASCNTFESLRTTVSGELDLMIKADFDTDYINSAILYEAMKDDSIQTPNSKPAGKVK